MAEEQKKIREAWRNVYDLVKSLGYLGAYEKDIEVLRNLVVETVTK